MNTRLFIVLLVSILPGCESEPMIIDGTRLVERNGIFIDPDTGNPITSRAEWYFENGQLMTYIHYVDGKRNGLNEDFYKNGTLAEKSTYIDGKRNGLHEEYYENGRLMERRHYIYGKGNGLWEWYSPEGELLEQKYYVNGEPASE